MRGARFGTKATDAFTKHLDRQAVEAQEGPQVACYRWLEEKRKYVAAVDAATFVLTNIGLPDHVFFVCRDPGMEAQFGKEPVFVVCDLNSGCIIPTLKYAEEREDAVGAARAFLLKIDDKRRKTVMDALSDMAANREVKRP